MENKEGFSFNYSAAQQQEVEAIRRKYMPNEESKLDRLRRLHRSATSRAQSRAIKVGVVGTVVMGAGMSFTMTDVGQLLGLAKVLSMLLGILVGVAGMALVALAYPVYNRVLKKERQRIAPEILSLTDELLQ
jgi:hypothetical protein